MYNVYKCIMQVANILQTENAKFLLERKNNAHIFIGPHFRKQKMNAYQKIIFLTKFL